MSFATLNLGGKLTPKQAQPVLEMKVKIATYGNQYAITLGGLEPRVQRQVDIGMYLIKCAAFERFLFDICGQEKARNWFRDFANNNGETKLANESDAYWQIRHALSHYGGAMEPLSIWKPNTDFENKTDIETILDGWGVVQGIDYSEPATDLLGLWSGMVNFINDVMIFLGVSKVAKL